MSASNEWTDWHLTPRGWERGTESIDGNQTPRERPADAALTRRYRETVSGMYSPMEKYSQDMWRGPDQARIDELLKKFGPRPTSL